MAARYGIPPDTLKWAFAQADASPVSGLTSKAIVSLRWLPSAALVSTAAAIRCRLGIGRLAQVGIAVLLLGLSFTLDLAVSPNKPIDSIVMVSNGTGHGAGVVVDAERGYVLTNVHVIGDRNEVVVRLRDGRELPAKVLRRANDDLDLVLLKVVTPLRIKAASLSCRLVETAESVVAIGHPGPFRWAVSKGYVAAHYSKAKPLGRALVLDLTIWHGNSGGGLFDDHDRLIGIITAMYGKRGPFGRVYSGFSFAISGPDLCRFLRRAQRTA